MNEGALSRVDAIYFTLATMTTTGFGDIQSRTGGCRAIVSVQMILGFFFIGWAVTASVTRFSGEAMR